MSTLVSLIAVACASVTVAVKLSPCDVTQRGAVGDNRTEDTAALQAVLDDVTCSPVILPAPGAFLSRALNLSAMSGRSLLIADGAQLVVWRDPKTYSTTHANNMFLSANSGDGSWAGPLVTGLTIAGGGTIIGGGAAWWPLGQTVTRPRLIWLPLVDGIVIANLTLLDSPAWNIGVRGDNVLIENVHVIAGGAACDGYEASPNTDGFNIGGHHITVRDCTVHNGDDCIP